MGLPLVLPSTIHTHRVSRRLQRNIKLVHFLSLINTRRGLISASSSWSRVFFKKSNLRRCKVETFKDNLAGSQVTSKTGIQSRCTRQLPWLLNSNRLLLNLKMGECLQSYWITILFKTLKTKYQNCTILFRVKILKDWPGCKSFGYIHPLSRPL